MNYRYRYVDKGAATDTGIGIDINAKIDTCIDVFKDIPVYRYKYSYTDMYMCIYMYRDEDRNRCVCMYRNIGMDIDTNTDIDTHIL